MEWADNHHWVHALGQHTERLDFYCLLYVCSPWPMPKVGALVGFDLAAQAVVLHAGSAMSWKFTNVVTETVVR